MIDRQTLLSWLPIEKERRRRQQEREELPKWDFYGPPCDCPEKRADGTCGVHPRARDKQRPPSGDWKVWLILSGRGFGKTRTGAQWVIECIRHLGSKARFALVGHIASDVRDTMIEGESGILASSPPWFKPLYEPSKRRLTWPNGGQAFCYSSEEPGYFRGPQFHGAWCLVGSTKVLMADGTEKPIRHVCRGDFVQTRLGPRLVTSSLKTKQNATIYRVEVLGGRVVSGTYEHPVFVEGLGFVPLGSLKPGMRVCVSNASSGAAGPGTPTAVRTTSQAASGSIAKSGRRRTGRSRRGTPSTTRTGTRRTTVLRTWRCCLTPTIARSISRKTSGLTANRHTPILRRHGSETPKRGNRFLESASFVMASTGAGRPTRGGIARRSAFRLSGRGGLKARLVRAISAAARTRRLGGPSGTAQGNATWRRASCGHLTDRRGLFGAPNATLNSGVPGRTHDSAGGNAPSSFTLPILSVRKLSRRADVYDIAVDGAREFFANSILVHNCDELAKWSHLEDCWDNLQFGLRLGVNEGWTPKTAVTTTPLPLPLIKELINDDGTVVVRGSTYENRANLAPTFLKQIEKKYEGTRLGRQEIFGEILEDNPGALWTPSSIENHRVDRNHLPEFGRIVVAIDPSVADPTKLRVRDEDNIAEAGIISGAMDEYGEHFYILGDHTVKGHPLTWGRTAVQAYQELLADSIVAEVNNGGSLIETLLRTIDENIAYREVRASRGKAIRAEPIASLYEQGKVHHAGRFPKLEEELTSWIPNSGMKSPNRLDALVWCVTDLSLGGVPIRDGGNPFPGWRG